jgi:hypothetical protein
MPWDIIPTDGWHFFDGDGTKVEGNSHDELVKNVIQYRISNNFPTGNPEVEVDTQICARQPSVCGAGYQEANFTDAPAKLYGQPLKRRLIDRIAQWTANRTSRLGAVHYVPAEEAQRRAAICAACPQNTLTWKSEATKDCAPCRERISALEIQSFKLKKGNQLPIEKRLGACRALGHINEVAIWLEEPQLRHRKYFLNDTPSVCWLRAMENITPDGCSKNSN